MDTRKLTTGPTAPPDPNVMRYPLMFEGPGQAIASAWQEEHRDELVKRWNAYPNHLEVLDTVAKCLRIGDVAQGGLVQHVVEAALKGEPQEGPKPYTVMVRYQNPDDFRDHNTYHLHITDASDDVHEAITIAIDDLIAEKNDIDPGDEDRTEQVDPHRVDYKCLAIYEGHLTNLVQ